MIGIISRWNATCGVSMHAEMLCKELIRMGYEIRIFAPFLESANKWWHHKIIKEDEKFVIRCYRELSPGKMTDGWIDADVILSENPEILIVESYESIPYKYIEEVFRKWDGQKIAVIHEGDRGDIRYNLRVFDKLVVFDDRYLTEVVPDCSDIVEVIPYPCHPVNPGRRRFGHDEIKFFSFGRQPVVEYIDYIRALDILEKKYDIEYRVVRSNGLLPFRRSWFIQERKRLQNEEVYSYLHSSDFHLIPKSNTKRVVVSSTLFQCLGSLVPTIAPSTRHFEEVKNIVVTYRNLDDLVKKIEQLIEDDFSRKEIVRNAEKYVNENSADRIARKFAGLFRISVNLSRIKSKRIFAS